MKSNGTFRGFFAAVAGIISRFKFWGKPKSYGDPRLSDPYTRQRSRHSTKVNSKGRKRLQAPDFAPGTITYKDWLVRELGYDRRLADGYMYAYLNGYKVKMPMPMEAI